MSNTANDGIERSDVNRLLKALRHQEADRIPHLEFWVTSSTVYEYVLEKKLDYGIVDAARGGQSITPEDHVEFAGRLGMDAVVCNFNWRPNNVMTMASDGTEHYTGGSFKPGMDFADLEPPTPSTPSSATWSVISRPLRAPAWASSPTSPPFSTAPCWLWAWLTPSSCFMKSGPSWKDSWMSCSPTRRR